MAAGPIRVREIRFNVLEMRTRFPFRYGIASMTALPHLFVTAVVESGGAPVTGIASEGLPPKWFTKDPATRFEEDLPEFGRVIANAAACAVEAGESPSFFALWRDLFDGQAGWAAAEGVAPLLANLGVSLIERAVLDAVCRNAGRPLHELVAGNALGIDLGAVRPELAGREPADFFSRPPADSLECRHTVGLGDALDASDADDPDDGLPYTLADCVRTHGLRAFKIKLCGELGKDRERLVAIAAVLDRCVDGADYRFTLDGNEQYRTVDAFRSHWEELTAAPELRAFFERLLFVEQPLHRAVALDDAVGDALSRWRAAPPIIIDESEAELDSLPRALELGYSGASHKNCKGVVKGLANAALLADRGLVLSGEDLANVGPVALLQDLAVMALLRVGHVERNGHHYFRGLSMYPGPVQDAVLESHGDLYTRHPAGFATLAVSAGQLALDSVNRAGFGYAMPFDPSGFPPAGDWLAPTPAASGAVSD